MLNPFQGTTGPGYVCTTTCSGAASADWAPAKVGLSWQTFSPQNGEQLLNHHSGEILVSLEMGKALVHEVIQREGNSVSTEGGKTSLRRAVCFTSQSLQPT